jgi:hypothetical protein
MTAFSRLILHVTLSRRNFRDVAGRWPRTGVLTKAGIRGGKMTSNYSTQHYLTFEKGDLHQISTADWPDHVGSIIETLGMAERDTYRVPRRRLPWRADLNVKTERRYYGGNQRRLCPIIFDKVPDEFWLDINGGKHKEVHGLSAIGADLPIHITDYWSPTESPDPIFATRKIANELMGIIEENGKEPGTGANVVIVDQGLNEDYIKHLHGFFMGGWSLTESQGPGKYPRPGKYGVGHGSMLARNVLKVAPDAAIYDLPIVPQDINDSEKFLSTVHAAFDQVLETIEGLQSRDEDQWRRPWVFVNAWAVYNTRGEHPKGDYTQGREHKFNQLIAEMAKKFDIVFAAGNCGQFCPSRRCGVDDVGPGHSIIGANSLPDVLTVGAARADGMWLGYSSQGPGTLSHCKPDLCAASQFCEDDDAATVNTGTSAACAIAAGVVAAFRSRCGTALSPARLKEKLIATARPGKVWDNRIGHGIINAAAAFRAGL